MLQTSAPVLSLADLEAFDPRATGAGRERRFCCPLCGDDKPKDAAHRSIGANIETGLWNCYRCRAAGKLSDFWQDRPKVRRRVRVRGSLREALARETLPQVEAAPTSTEWRAHLKTVRALAGTSGAAYLQGRGVPLDLAHRCGVGFAASWYGRAAVVFPIRDRAGQLVAAQGRYLDGRENPKARTAGDKKQGVFSATVNINGQTYAPFDEAAPAIIITEAPIDALSLAACGFPALALCGTTGPAWLHRACAFRRALLAFDADDAGDGAAAMLTGELQAFGATCQRLRPEAGKDWNDFLLQSGHDALRDWLAARLLIDNQN
jgi:hypothetical protein